MMVTLEGSHKTELVTLIERLPQIKDIKERKTYFLSILPRLLYPFITQQQQHIDMPSWFTEVIQEMSKEENYIEGLGKLLALSSCSQEHLTRLFQQYLKITPTSFINSKRLELAYSKIIYTRDPILDIAFACGFQNISHFYHVFKKQYNTSPAMLRKKAVIQ